MLLSKEPLPVKAALEPNRTHPLDLRQRPEGEDQSVDISTTKTGQTSPETRERLLAMLYKFRSSSRRTRK